MGSITQGLSSLGRGLGTASFRKRNQGKDVDEVSAERLLEKKARLQQESEAAEFNREQKSLQDRMKNLAENFAFTLEDDIPNNKEESLKRIKKTLSQAQDIKEFEFLAGEIKDNISQERDKVIRRASRLSQKIEQGIPLDEEEQAELSSNLLFLDAEGTDDPRLDVLAAGERIRAKLGDDLTRQGFIAESQNIKRASDVDINKEELGLKKDKFTQEKKEFSAEFKQKKIEAEAKQSIDERKLSLDERKFQQANQEFKKQYQLDLDEFTLRQDEFVQKQKEAERDYKLNKYENETDRLKDEARIQAQRTRTKSMLMKQFQIIAKGAFSSVEGARFTGKKDPEKVKAKQSAMLAASEAWANSMLGPEPVFTNQKTNPKTKKKQSNLVEVGEIKTEEDAAAFLSANGKAVNQANIEKLMKEISPDGNN